MSNLLFFYFPAAAYGMLKDAHEKGVAVSTGTYDHLIRSLLAEGSIDAAMAVKDM